MKNFVAISTLIVNVVILIILGTFYFETRFVEPVAETTEPIQAISDDEEVDEMDIARKELLDKLSESGLTNVRAVIEEGKSMVDREDVTIEQLKEIARKTNGSSNYVDFILQEYKDYHSANYRYDFVLKKLEPSHDAYVGVSNELRAIRNKAYLKLGNIFEEQGLVAEAFFYYRDAFRLSSFGGYKKGDPGNRYLAEQRMKSILGLDDIESYTTWQ